MTLSTNTTFVGSEAHITLAGDIDASTAPQFRAAIEEALAQAPTRLVLFLKGVEYMASAGLRVLLFTKRRAGDGLELFLVETQAEVRETIEMAGFHYSVTMAESYDKQPA